MLELKTVILECKDISQLLSFYSQFLNWPVVFREDTFVRIQSRDTGMGIAFQYAEDYISPIWPLTEKAIQLGAKVANDQYGGEEWTTLLDPAGHPFCLVIWD